MSEITNIHGRKGGRGLRPWILLPKYFCVCALLGGLLAVVAVLPHMPEAGADPRWRLVTRIYDYVIIPGAAGAVVFGILLFLQHPREFLRMRWLQVKLPAVAIIVPLAHLQMSHELRQQEYMVWEFVWEKALLCLAAFALIALVGRLKPRLRQGYQAP